MKDKRHTCIICKKKRKEELMKKVFNSSWVCKNNICEKHSDFTVASKLLKYSKQLKKINPTLAINYD